MAWIESHDELPTHPKTRKAARKLGVSVPTVIGHLHVLWYWCLTHRPNGVLDGMDADDVADAAGWDDDGEPFVKALLAAGWLDDDAGTMVVHDWWDGAGKTIKRRKFATERQRRARDTDATDDTITDESHDSHTDVTRDTQTGHGADSDRDSDTTKPLSTAVDQDDGFEHFWQVWPKRNGKKLAKEKAHRAWSRLTLPERRDAYRGAKHYADASNAGLAGAKDAFRWLQGREWPDWQEPAKAEGDLRRHPDGRIIGMGGGVAS